MIPPLDRLLPRAAAAIRRSRHGVGRALAVAIVAIGPLAGAPDPHAAVPTDGATTATHHLERLLNDADRVVFSLDRLADLAGADTVAAGTARRAAGVETDARDLESLRAAALADNRALAIALHRVLASGAAVRLRAPTRMQRHHELSRHTEQKADALAGLGAEIRDLDDEVRALQARLRTLADDADASTVALRAEAAWNAARRDDRRRVLARGLGELAATLPELIDVTCRLYRELEVDQPCPSDIGSLAVRGIDGTGAVGSVRSSVYAPFDRATREPKGYGLYTYVLFPDPDEEVRARIFVKELTDVTASDGGPPGAPARDQLNLFSLPVRDAAAAHRLLKKPVDDGALARFVGPEVYDHDLARSLLDRFCANEEARMDFRVCRLGRARVGPYLLTHPRPQSARAVVEVPYLFVDLSHVRPQAYGAFIQSIKEQVRRRGVGDRELIYTVRLRVLNLTLTAADWVRPIGEGIRGIIAVAF